MKKKSLFIGASLCWCAALVVLALQPRSFVSIFLRGEEMSSVAHMAGHFGLALVLAYALHLNAKRGLGLARALFTVFSVCALAGVLTEAVQILVPDRQASWIDFKYDMKGALAGLAVYYGGVILRELAAAAGFSPSRALFCTLQNVLLPNRPAQAALILSSAALFLGLDSIQLLTVYCLASCL